MALAAVLAACSGGSDKPATPSAGEISGRLTVFAASSLAEAFNDVKAALQARHPALEVSYNFAGTPTLRTQIEQGAKAGVFASANTQQMDLAVQSGIIQAAPQVFAANRLVVAVPAGTSAVRTLLDLAKPGIKLVLTLKDVPVGGYAREAIARMDAGGEFGAGYGQKVLSNLVSEEPNVRQALSKVVLGEADAAIVYTTDVTADVTPRVTQIAIPERYNVLALYPIAAVKRTERPDLAGAFIAFVLSPQGRAILEKYGFKEAPP